jgi:cytochrome c-type biogenesis protein CcmE
LKGNGSNEMRKRQRQRLLLAGGAIGLAAGAVGLVVTALGDSVAFFASPSDIAQGTLEPDRRLRLGGLVVEGSVEHRGSEVTFALTDMAHDVEVVFRGVLPDLFREGQGIVAMGAMAGDGTFRADDVLAKHDENYMPPEVSDALQEAGHWLPEES